ncbi:uncharacterized protein STEHIDRAFT_117643 [Stereum hirsutum FP-91666 SS1]|uniref:uncharacterized protein n=1 Tax=Stereum hirsutum (strain FP-91666) TaxID=721885 RepID=UPI000440A660|nr:uncharacterized protein STEHIDRAFT_117643 [Stereum hirsutum FP-91666 SS1]EIM92669.1 hypothetical protein STEHIDRAFT_117643 [Stereum hirsutum FP-91666 SS1]
MRRPNNGEPRAGNNLTLSFTSLEVPQPAHATRIRSPSDGSSTGRLASWAGRIPERVEA